MSRPRKDKLEPDYSCLEPGLDDKHRPTIHSRSKVIEFVCAGFTQAQIASYMRLDHKTIRKYYANEIDNSLAMRTSKLARNLFLDALKGDRISREFWLKCKGGFSFCVNKDTKSNTDALLEKLIDKL